MFRIGRNKIVRFALILCVMMQVVAMMPHHHHEGSERVCLNYFHLEHAHNAAAECCTGCCTDDHGHDNDPFTPCNSHKLVITQPERERPETEAAILDIPDDCHCGYCTMALGLALDGFTESQVETGLRMAPDIEPPVVRYLTRAKPVRGPDFIV